MHAGTLRRFTVSFSDDYTLLDYYRYFTGDGREGLGKAKDARSE